MNMNQDLENIEMVNDELHDEWLTQNLKFTQIEPSHDFTKKVMEQIEVKPNPLNGSPLFWVLAAIPGVVLLWLILFTLGTLNSSYHLNLNFIPNISNFISLYSLSKYVLMITLAGLFFIGLDHIMSKGLSHRESFFSFMLV
jgi:hypothetical protein